MNSIIVFVLIAISVMLLSVNIYKIIDYKVTFKRYYPYRKLVIVGLLSLPWLFLFFPFTTEWSTYWSLVIVRVPITIIWLCLTVLGLFIDIKMQNRYKE